MKRRQDNGRSYANFIVYADKHSTSVLADISQNLCETFQIVPYHYPRHIDSLFKAQIDIAKAGKAAWRNECRPDYQAWKKTVDDWKKMQNIDYRKNSFYSRNGQFAHQKRFWSFSRIRPAKGTVPSGKSMTVSILGSISEEGAIHISPKKEIKSCFRTHKRKTNKKAVGVEYRRIVT